MNLVHILVFALLAVPFVSFVPHNRRSQVLLILSLAAVIWFLADDGIVWYEGILYGFTLLLIVVVWRVTHPDTSISRMDRTTLVILAGFSVLIIFLASQTQIVQVLVSVILIGSVSASCASLGRIVPDVTLDDVVAAKRRSALIIVWGIVLVLFVLKVPGWNYQISGYMGTAIPIVWIGFSYLAFRLIAVLIDFRAGRLPSVSLQDLLVYTLFFPAYTAGPIDRIQRFIPELHVAKPRTGTQFGEGSVRIAIGVFKKFVIADTLALFALSSSTFPEVHSTSGIWILLYVYAFQIYFDFSGYSDVAIGLGRLYGITLPENFDRPYFQPNIQQFWQRWHITLSTWFRIYYFIPFSRMLLQSPVRIPQWVIVFLAQVTTMILIGLWHGVTFNFVFWGLWHGVGLYLHKLFSDNTRGVQKRINRHVWTQRLLHATSVLLTFHFVVIGWVFFALPDVGQSFDIIKQLFGLGI